MSSVALIAVVFVYQTNRRELDTGRHMMDDALLLRPEISTFSDVLAFSRKYDAKAWQSQDCVESHCFVMAGRSSDDAWDRHPKLAYVADRISGRKWRYWALMWVKDGKLSDIRQRFAYMTPDPDSDILYHVINARTRVSERSPESYKNPFYELHRTFAAFPSYLNSQSLCVWVDPTATQERALLRFNLDCVLRISGCRSAADLAPEAWRAYQSDERLLDANGVHWRDEATAWSESF